MTIRMTACACLAFCAFAQPGRVEPAAGTWKTWALSSGSEFRVAPPPANSTDELAWVRAQDAAQQNATIAEQIRYWDAGSPGYRWVELISNRFNSGQPLTSFPHRVYTYVTMAIHDATIAAWDSKYFYNRPRSSEMDATIRTAVETPNSPSYPSEHAVVSFAAAAVLSYLLPGEAARFQDMADEAARSRLHAGVSSLPTISPA